jgi:hypothetical protein
MARTIRTIDSLPVVVFASLLHSAACSSTSSHCTENANGQCQDTDAEDGAAALDGSAVEAGGGTCTGVGQCGSPPHCALGCYLMLGLNALDSTEDTCAGAPEPCDQFFTQPLCEAQGCTWTGPGSD